MESRTSRPRMLLCELVMLNKTWVTGKTHCSVPSGTVSVPLKEKYKD